MTDLKKKLKDLQPHNLHDHMYGAPTSLSRGIMRKNSQGCGAQELPLHEWGHPHL